MANHTAFVTGAGQNIGRAIALALAKAGIDLVINGYRRQDICDETARMCEDLGVRTLVLMGDVGSGAQCRAMADAAREAFGTIDILINNAAIRPSKPFLEMDDEDWHRVMNVDLDAAFYLSRALLGGMVDGGWGRIVNFAGMNAINGYTGRAPVSAAKHGVWGLTKALAKEFGPKGITVNCISPGPIRSEHEDPSMTAHIEAQLSKIPLGRLGEPDDIAALTAFLCSEGGGFVSGQMIAANGAAQS